MQSPFSVAVFARFDGQGLWDLARDHYGSHTPMAACDSVHHVIRAVASGEAVLGVLPLPQDSEPDPWWPQLLAPANDSLRILARLPFGAHGNARGADAEALAIGDGTPEESGLDRTLLAIECAAEIMRARTLKILSALGLVCTFFASCDDGGAVGLIEIEGFLPISDPRLAAFRTEMGARLRQLRPLGGYAVPLSPQVLAAKG